MTDDKVIWVVGTPSGGTSAVAGMLHHLGVNMGNLGSSIRPYTTFEDTDAKRFDRPTDPKEAAHFIAGPKGGRRFRAYLRWRLENADERPCGIKIGSTYWLGDPDPSTLPVRILKVNRPLEASIPSDAKYLWDIRPRTPDEIIRRACQIAGYWMAKEIICQIIPPTLEIEFDRLVEDPQMHAVYIQEDFGLKPTTKQFTAAVKSIEPDKKHI